MKYFKIILLVLMFVSFWIPLGVDAYEETMGHSTTPQTTELSIPLTEVDDATLLQYALQLRKTQPDLFMGAQGVLVGRVMPDSQAEKKGLQRGDIIVAYHGQQINYTAQLISLVKSHVDKQQVELQFIHAGVLQTVMLQGGQIGIRLLDIMEKVLFEQLQHLLEEGKQAYYSADYPTAMKKLEQGLFLARQAKHQQFIGEFLGAFGVMYNSLGQYQKALDYHRQALKIKREIGDRHGKGVDLSNIGMVYDSLGQYQKALDYYQQALSIDREIGNRHGKSAVLTNIGIVYHNLGQYQKALDYYQQALSIDREIGDRRGEGGNLTNIAVVYAILGQYQKALDSLQQILKIKQEVGDRRGEGGDLTNIGAVYAILGQYQKALDSLQQALKIKREISDRRGEGGDLSNIGAIYDYLGQYQKALDLLQQALKIRREIGDRHGEASDLTNIGTVYNNLGQYQKALGSLQQALKIKREIGDRYGESSDLTNIGIVYDNLGQYQKALKYFKQALSIDRESGDRRGEGTDLTNIGNMHQNLGQYQTALDYLQQALSINREIGNRRGEGFDLTNIGVVHQKRGNYQEAKDAFQKGTTILETINSSDLWLAQRGLAFTEAKLNQFNTAITHYEQALNNLEQLRTKLKEKEYKFSFIKERWYVYDEFITLLQTLHQQQPTKGYDRKALIIFERKQARVFLEDMGKSSAWHFAGIPDDISQQDRELEYQIETARKNYTEALAQSKDAKPHRKRLEKLEAEQQAFEKMLEKNYQAYYALKYPKPATLEKLQKEVLQEGEFMLVYNVMENNIALWVIGKQVFQLLVVDISEVELNAKIKTFRPNELIKAIDDKSPDLLNIAKNTLAIMIQTGYELYTLLLPAEVRALLKDVRTLYIIPTGSLYGLPFGALNTNNPDKTETPHHLIEDYSIAYLSSASLLKTLRDTERKATQPYPLLAFADPKYPKTCSQKLGSATNNVIQIARTEEYFKLMGSSKKNCFTAEDELPSTQKEAKIIAKYLEVPKESEALQLRDKASRENVFIFNQQQRLDDYQYVLFAAHAVLPEEISYIKQSAIVLSHSDLDAPNVGYLTRDNVFGLQMNADLVSLSACNTGRGEEIKGEGIRGLTRAFMFAGTPAVSVTLWDISASSAKYLSIGLFQYLKQGKPLPKALRQSKLDFLTNPKYSAMFKKHPFYWAPTVVFGDGALIKRK